MTRAQRNACRDEACAGSVPLVEYLSDAAAGCQDPRLRMQATGHLLNYYTQMMIRVELDRIAEQLEVRR